MTGTTIQALQTLYLSLGGQLSDTYPSIADGTAVGNLVTLPDMVSAIAYLKAPAVTVSAVSQSGSLYDTSVSDMQGADFAISGNAATGTLKYLSTGAIPAVWGNGNFMALQFSATDWSVFDSVKVGLDPSVSSGLVEIKNDPDHNGVFKVTDKNAQKFVVQRTIGSLVFTDEYDLSGLTCETA